MGAIRNVELRVFKGLRSPVPASLLGRLAFWLLLIATVASFGRLLPGKAGTVFFGLSCFALGALVCVLVPLVYRYTIGRFLWKVRNRLIVTYLLMGLAPVVLFLALASISIYILLGQFAIFAASDELDRALDEMAAQNRDYARHLARTLDERALDTGVPLAAVRLPEREMGDAGGELLAQPPGESLSRIPVGSNATHLAAFVDGKPLQLALDKASLDQRMTSVPGWVSPHFRGVVLADGHLYLRALDTERIGAHKVTLISSLPLVTGSIDQVAHGLGRITIFPEISRYTDNNNGAPISSEAQEQHANAVRPNTVTGGVLAPAQHFYDVPVNFYAPLDTIDWRNGANHESGVHITSRPTLLFGRLFITSLQVAAFVQELLIGLTIFFSLLELGAFLMAMRLNQTITRSISDLYAATLAIDGRNFAHRIEVTRKDQLAALSQSFNTMSASLEGLLEEQREKERLLGELEIAHEVQANLFPHGHVSLPTLEVHGVCQPARTVSGDYYDFLVAGSSGLSFALGDISGKGISAALLMASLHSAVRAYRFMGEDMASAGPEQAARLARIVSASRFDGDGFEDGKGLPPLAASFAEPGQILGLLNRHLYRSTQPEKYATLFLAHYDGRTAELTYSTGGQPPPLLLRADDSVVRLDCGGTVIGLMDAMEYDQGRETLRPGDIVIAYSDGVTEPENDFGDFGEDRLLDIVRRHRKLPLDQITDQVLLALRSWIGTEEQPDDITLVLARQR